MNELDKIDRLELEELVNGRYNVAVFDEEDNQIKYIQDIQVSFFPDPRMEPLREE